MTKFVLHTSDTDWIARHNGQVADNGRVTVQVDTVEHVPFAGNDWLRHHFTDVPRDVANGWVMCPAKWVA
jgi:hypothetical protein